MMGFHIGQKVMCVNARSSDWSIEWLKDGAVYTVAGFCSGHNRRGKAPDKHGALAVILGEKPTKPHGFFAVRFRPLIERKTDISIFTGMLTPKQLERVD